MTKQKWRLFSNVLYVSNLDIGMADRHKRFLSICGKRRKIRQNTAKKKRYIYNFTNYFQVSAVSDRISCLLTTFYYILNTLVSKVHFIFLEAWRRKDILQKLAFSLPSKSYNIILSETQMAIAHALHFCRNSK